MIRYFLILFLVILFQGCKTTNDSEKIIKSILKVESLSSYDYEILYVRDNYNNYPFTIYCKINIDSSKYLQLKDDHEDCLSFFQNYDPRFESQQVSMENYDSFKEEHIPIWFDIQSKEIDIWLFYDVNSLEVNSCLGHYNAWALLKYHDKNCYIILDCFG